MVRALILDVSPDLLEQRRRNGLDRHDEVWEGVLHMVPPPHSDHQELNDELGLFFRLHWQACGLGRTLPETGVKRPGTPDEPDLGPGVPRDYRTPDRSFLLPDGQAKLQGGWIVGPPDVVLEIRSPRDESLDKLPWYFELGVGEVILIDRDTRAVEVLTRGARGFEPVQPDAGGWLASALLRTELRAEAAGGAQRPTLRLRRSDDPGRAHRIV